MADIICTCNHTVDLRQIMNGLFVSSSFILCEFSNKYISHQVRQVTLKAVLSQQAYLLFYTKLTPTQDLKVKLKASNFFVKGNCLLLSRG